MPTSDAIQSENKIFQALDSNGWTKTRYYKVNYQQPFDEEYWLIQASYSSKGGKITIEIWIDWEEPLFVTIKSLNGDLLLDCDGIPTEEDLEKLVNKIKNVIE